MLEGTRVKNLGKLKKIGGSGIFHISELEDLGQLEEVGDSLTIGKKLKSIGKLSSVGGELQISKDSKLDFSNIKIGNKTKK